VKERHNAESLPYEEPEVAVKLKVIVTNSDGNASS